MSGTRGSSGLASVSIEQMESKTEESDVTPKHKQKKWTKRLTLRDRQGGRPLVSQDIQANRAVGVDVWVINLGREADLGGLEWIIGGERNGEEENASSIRRITLH